MAIQTIYRGVEGDSSKKFTAGSAFDTAQENDEYLDSIKATVIENVAALASTPVVAGRTYYLKEYNSGTGLGGGSMIAYTGADTPDNGVIFATGTPGVLLKREIKSEFSFYEFGSVEDGTADDTAAFTAGIAACNTYGVKRIRYSNKLKITSAVLINQSGIEIMGSPPQYDPNGSISAKPRILFTTAAAKLTFRGVRGTCMKNVYIDGTNTAATPLVLDRVEFSTWENVFVDNVTDTGWVFTETSGVNDVANAWNTFINCGASAPIGMFFSGTSVSGSWHNTFINTTIGYTGAGGIILTNCDNLTFIQSYISKDSGSGAPVWWRVDTVPATAGNPNSIYFYHLQGGGGAPVIDATCSNPGAIYGFDMSNGLTWPTIPNGARMSITADGINSPGWGTQRFYSSRGVNDWRSDTEDAFEFRDDAHRGLRLWGLGFGGSSTRLRIDPTTKFGTFYYSFDGSADQLSFSWNTEGLVLKTNTPASASATGTAGQFAWDANYLYICTATNTWKRVAVATW